MVVSRADTAAAIAGRLRGTGTGPAMVGRVSASGGCTVRSVSAVTRSAGALKIRKIPTASGEV
jgi:hypothetical protein